MIGDERLHEPPDLPRGAGVKVVTERRKAIAVLAVHTNDQLTVFFVLLFAFRFVSHESPPPLDDDDALYIHSICTRQQKSAKNALYGFNHTRAAPQTLCMQIYIEIAF